MTSAEIQELFRTRLGLRLGDSMATYALSRFDAASVPSIPIIAADARTGIPLHTAIVRTALSSEAPRSADPTVLTLIP